MKRILYIVLLLVLNFSLKSQTTYPLTQSLGSSATLVKVPTNGGLQAVLVATPFADTTAANAVAYVKYTAGAMIRTTSDGKFWKRNEAKTAWGSLGADGSKINFFEFLTDSTISICYGDGTCDTISFNNNNVFMTVNNSFGGCNNLLSGGVVTANNPTVNLVFDVTAADYTIGCKAYHTDIDQVTLADGDASFGRFDVIAVDTNEAVIVIQGTPSSDPQVPQINSASQLALTTILVPAGATTATQLGITQTVIYDENLQVAGGEWDSSGVSWTRDFANTSFPAHLTKDLLLSGSTVSGSQIQWTTTDTMRNGQFDVFKFYIRLTDAWVAGQGLDISFYNGTTKVSNSITFTNNSYGFDQTVTGSYQTIAIPMANWVLSDSIFFSVVFKPLATPFSSQAFRLDWVQLQGGINQALGGSSGLYIWNQYSLAQPANYWIAGSAKIQGGITSPNINYVLSEQYGYNSSVTAIAGTALGAYSQVTGNTGTALGDESVSTGGLAVGYYARSGGSTNISIGGNTSSATSSNLLGRDGVISGTQSNGIGQNVTVTHNNTTAIGYFATSTRNNEFMLGSEYTSIEARGMSRGVAGYVLTDSLGDGSYLVLRPVTAGTLTAANNGTSLSGTTVQLGQAEAAVGNPAILLSNREIPMANFYLSLNASAAQSNNIFQTKNSSAAVRARITSAASFSNTGGQTGAEIFGDGASASGSNVVAVGNAASGGGSANTVIGTSAAGGSSGGNIAIGQAATISDGITGITLIGTASSASTSGNQTLIGSGITSTGRSTGVGTGGTFSSTNNFGFGEQVNVSHTYSGALGFGATTTAANQLVIGANVNGGTEGAINDIYWGNGITTPSPDDVSLNANSGSGTDIAGGNTYYNASRATGNAATGVHIFQTSTVGASGTTLQTLAPKIQINGSGILSYDGVLPTSGSGGTDSVIARNSSTGQWYLTTVSAGAGLTTASEGLTAVGTDVQMGGSFTTDHTIALAANTLLFTANTLAADPAISITSTSTAAASNLQKGINISLSGANSNSTQTTYGIYSSNTHTGTGATNYAGYFTAGNVSLSVGIRGDGFTYGVHGHSTAGNGVLATSSSGSAALFADQTGTSTFNLGVSAIAEGAGTTNIGGQFEATGASNNYAIIVPSGSGRVGIGTSSPSQLLHVNGVAQIGTAGSTLGQINISGNTSGTVTIQPAAAAGTYTLTLPINDGDASQFLQTDGSGVLTWASAAGGAPAWNDITSPTGTQTLAWDDAELNSWSEGSNTETWWTTTHNSLTTGTAYLNSSSSLTSGIIDDIAITGTAQLTNSRGLRIQRSGANASSAQTITAAEFSVTNTGTTSTNNALTITASGASTNNAINVAAGRTMLPAGTTSANAQSLYLGALGFTSVSDVGLGLYTTNGYTVFLGHSGLIFKDNTAVIDLGQSPTFGTTNRIRMAATAEGNLKFSTLGATAAVVLEASGGEGANAALRLYKDEGDDNDDKWSLNSDVSANALTFVNNTTEVFRLNTVSALMTAARFEAAKGANVASGGDLTLGTDGNIFHITGTTTINAITTANWQAGSEIILIFDASVTVKNNTSGGAGTATLLLAGGADFSATSNDVLKLVYDGTNWFEVSRSVN